MYTRIHNAGINECSIGFVQLHVRKSERERERDREAERKGETIEESFAGEARYRNKYKLTANVFIRARASG